jgi:phage protein U
VLEKQNSPFPSRKTTDQRENEFEIVLSRRNESNKKHNNEVVRNASRNKSEQKKREEIVIY